MSLKDELEALERRVRDRLRELQPLVTEFRDLEQVAQRLGISIATASRPGGPEASPTGGGRSGARGARRTTRSRAASQKARASRRGTGTTAPPGRPARAQAASPSAAAKASPAGASPRARVGARTTARRPSARREQLLALVKERPGITVRDAASAMGAEATSLYRVVRQLESQGEISKQGLELRPA